MNSTGKVIQAISIGLAVATFLLHTRRVNKAIELCKECHFLLKSKPHLRDEKLCKQFYEELLQTLCFVGDYTIAIKYALKLLHIHREYGTRHEECWLSIKLAIMYFFQSKYVEAKELCERALAISKNIGDRNAEASCYGNLGTVYQTVGKYEKAREYHEKALAIRQEIGDRNGEASCHFNLATMFRLVREYHKAIQYNEKALAIFKDIGDRTKMALSYSTIGTVFISVGDYVKAGEYLEKGLAISKEIGDRNGEASCHINLAAVFELVGEYRKAIEYNEKALAIFKEIGDRNGEAYCHGNLANVFRLVGEYHKTIKYNEKALAIFKETGDRNGEASCHASLATVFELVGECHKAIEYNEKALAFFKEIGDRNKESSCYGNIGTVLFNVGDYVKAREYLEKGLAISKEIGDRKGEATCYGNLGGVFQSIGDYEKAREYHQEATAKHKEIGDKNGEASSLGNLGLVFESVGELEKAREYYEKALAIQKKIGDRYGEAASYENLGTLLHSLGKYASANTHLQKALMIRKEIGDRRGEASSHGNLGVLFLSLGDIEKAKHYHEKSLAIRKAICDRKGEALDYQNLGIVFQFLREFDKAEEYYKKGLSISEEIGDVEKQFSFLCKLAWIKLLQEKIQEAFLYLFSAVQKCEDLRGFLRNNDQFKISFTDKNASPYWLLTALLCDTGSPKEALYVSELGRARALADLMSARYSVENQISAKPQTWIGIERVMDKECYSSCLYVSYSCENINLWILKASGVVHLRRHHQEGKMSSQSGFVYSLDDLFVNESFRRFSILPEEHCEDRSLDGFQCKPESSEEDNQDTFRIGKDDKDNIGPKLNLSLCYKLIIAPVVDLLEGPEIIIVPDRSLYNIPFAALPDEKGKCLSETFRIRVVPSLTTLKLIHDSPADYHSQTGALIVGNPDVGEVHFRGRLTQISRLPCAENEAKMVGEMLSAKLLLGQQATKQAVLEEINSVSLIHFAAHGDAERGEIALAPAVRIPNKIPQEEHYLLTMSDISKVQLRAKLVVLSCCHSARGQIRAEGVVGIARAFLGSGARSVLVAQWALDDSATEQFMSHFYEYLVRGESASESLHEAMKWMRCNGYSDVRQWAPFMLIGDNVTFDFGK